MSRKAAAWGALIGASLALVAACGDDTGGAGGGTGDACTEDETAACTCADGTDGERLCVEGTFTSCSKDGIGCVSSGEENGCHQGDQLFCKCVDGSEGTKTCVVSTQPGAPEEGDFGPCSNANGDCAH